MLLFEATGVNELHTDDDDGGDRNVDNKDAEDVADNDSARLDGFLIGKHTEQSFRGQLW